MKILNGLEDYEAVKFNEGYIIQLPHYETFKINGIRKKTSIDSNQFYIQDLSSIKLITIPPLEISHYLDSNNKQKSVEQVEQIKNIDKDYFDSYSKEYVYPDRDTEYNFRKLKEVLEDLSPVYLPQIEVETDISVKVIGEQIDTESEFIITPYLIGETTFSNLYKEGVFKIPSVGSIVLDELMKLKEIHKDDDFQINTQCPQSSLINKTSFFYNLSNYTYKLLDINNSSIFLTLKEAQDFESEIRSIVKDTVKVQLKENQVIKQVERQEIHKDLIDLRQFINEYLDVKKQCYMEKDSALKKIDAAIKKVIP